ncbi:MAG: hypothetical protein HXX11_06030 [Desulfuromonadales bacterium]|nr:hypothetical protein [Desulfuromonadales bacterium]
MSNAIKYYDAQQWLIETQPKRAKLPAVVVAIFVTLLTSAVAGLLVGLCFLGTIWCWAIGIACISLLYILMDRVQVQLYHGYVKGRPFWALITYSFFSTDYRPCYAPWWCWRWYYRW